MKDITFTQSIQAILAIIVVMVVCYLSVVNDAYKDAIVQLAMIGFGFWLGSSRSSQAKDEKPTEVK